MISLPWIIEEQYKFLNTTIVPEWKMEDSFNLV
jgi:hypothetical protein